jgi:ATP-dependent Lhr-like helicase
LVQGIDHACAWLVELIGLGADAAEQIAHYLSAGRTALGVMPTQSTVVVERFFDESGGMQLVIHSPFGARINRAWGLALRKRFCRRFNFELQAAAVEDAIVLSLSSSHSFALSEVASYLNAKTARDVLVQALLDAPMFGTRWRWNATVALALPRQRGGKRVALPLQRMLAQDLLAAVFPDQVACAENLTGEREIPNDPLVQQTLRDCLEDVMDVDGLIKLLGAVAAGTVRMHNIDTTEPSPLAAEVLGARPYAFLDDAPLEERRTQAVTSRRWLDAAQASELGRLDPSAIERVRAEVWPQATSANELHDALLQLGALAEPQWQAEWADDLGQLAAAGRATCAATGARRWWVSAERLPEFAAVVPNLTLAPPIDAPARYADKRWDAGDALRELLRGYLQCVGPCTAAALANTFGVTSDAVDLALTALEVEGFALRGNFTGAPGAVEWCERRLLARIHRYTVDRLRREIEPVSAADFMRHLSRWQHLDPASQLRGPDAVAAVLAQLEGFEAPAVAWETAILPARVADYDPAWLDELCRAGRVLWLRLSVAAAGGGTVRHSPIAFVTRRNAAFWRAFAAAVNDPALGREAKQVLVTLRDSGASFFDEIIAATGLLPSQVESALSELAAAGLVSADSFSGLRLLLLPIDRRRPSRHGRRAPIEDAGRWSVIRRPQAADRAAAVEHLARALLRRYGVVCWQALAREGDWLPPWRELAQVLRRLEARGEIRGGRFVAGLSGEQFALPEAVGALRAARREASDALLAFSAADPLNLIGVITPGARIPALAGNRLLLRGGSLAGSAVAGRVEIDPAAGDFNTLRNALLRLPGVTPATRVPRWMRPAPVL